MLAFFTSHRSPLSERLEQLSPQSPPFFIAFFTSHRSPLSERLEQATSLRKADVLPVGREATSGNTSAIRRLSGSKWAKIQYIRNSNTFTVILAVIAAPQPLPPSPQPRWRHKP